MMPGTKSFPRRFLIPTDGGLASAAAARLGLRLARALGASVRVLSVVDPQMVYRFHRLSSPEPRAELEREAHAAVAAVAREARRLGVPCQTTVREGPVSGTILDEARKSRPGLLVLGTRGHTGLARVFLGSVAAAVAARAPCPVLLSPPAAHASRGRKRS
jgi:nucleotide-binding universal stress UspA family protein